MALRLILGILIILVCSAFFSGTETAVFSLSSLERKRLSTQHPHRSSWVERLIHHPQRTLITILIGNVLVNTLASVLITLFTIRYLGAHWLGVMMVLFTLLLLLCGEVIPKLYAVRRNEEWAGWAAIPLNIFALAIWPLRKLVRIVTNKIINVLLTPGKTKKTMGKAGDRPVAGEIESEEKKEEGLVDSTVDSEEELKMLVRMSGEEGVLPYEETKMIRKLLALGDRQIKEIMKPRPQIVGFDIDDDVSVLIETVRRNHVSYIPVYQKSIDNILGLLSSEKFMLSDRASVKPLLQPVYFVPETKRIDELFLEFQKDKRGVAIAVDEHGGTAGIVANEDILEEIFGEIYDEFESPRQMIQRISGHEFIVDAKISLRDFNEFFNANLQSESEETLAGFILEKLGHIPVGSEQVEYDHWKFTVLAVDGRRIDQVRVVKI